MKRMILSQVEDDTGIVASAFVADVVIFADFSFDVAVRLSVVVAVVTDRS
ncbi:MAG: hypothetical protein K2I08_06140 [Muribaculaceae bacterium]|nr:hypothetical protein [Muribaculaceae bacterium]